MLLQEGQGRKGGLIQDGQSRKEWLSLGDQGGSWGVETGGLVLGGLGCGADKVFTFRSGSSLGGGYGKVTTGM